MITSALVAWSLGAERTQLPVSARADAQEALDRARGGGALRFAADALAQADSLFLAASREATRVSAWPRPFRDFRTASALYRQTEAAADSSLALAESTQQNAAMEAGSVLEAARDALEVAEECRVASRTVHRHLAQARQLFHEAQALEAQARYGEASSRARASLAEAGKVCDAAGGLVARFADPEAVKRWQGWIRETIQESRASGAVALIVIKELNELRLYRGGKLVKTYPADMGSNQLHQKLRQGDKATPEGRYRVSKKNPNSQYKLALLLNYPTEADQARLRAAIARGDVAKGTKLGGLIEIHGDGGRGTDWTLGCVALSNPHMREVYDIASVGTPVTIVGGSGESGRFSRVAQRREKR